MTTYAKLTPSGTLDILSRVPNVSNPLPATVEAYAAANGYKPVVHTASPGTYYREGWKETAKQIRQTWTAWTLNEAKETARVQVQAWLDSAIATRATVPCAGIPAGIVYDIDACLNAIGMRSVGGWPAFIDSADNLHNLDAQGVAAVANALTQYRAGLYAKATAARNAIADAADVDAVAAAVDSLKS